MLCILLFASCIFYASFLLDVSILFCLKNTIILALTSLMEVVFRSVDNFDENECDVIPDGDTVKGLVDILVQEQLVVVKAK